MTVADIHKAIGRHQRSQLLLFDHPREQLGYERANGKNTDGSECHQLLYFNGFGVLDHRASWTSILDVVRSLSARLCVYHGGDCRCYASESTSGGMSDKHRGHFKLTDICQWGAVAITFLFFYYAAFGCTWGMVCTISPSPRAGSD